MDEPTTCCTGWHVQNEVHFMLWGPNSLVMVCRIRSADNFDLPGGCWSLGRALNTLARPVRVDVNRADPAAHSRASE